MAIFIGTPKNQSRLEAGIRKDRGACFGALRLPGAFRFLKGVFIMEEKKIDGFFKDEIQIIKKTNDGKDAYFKGDEEVKVYTNDFRDLIDCVLTRFQTLVDLLDDHTYDIFGHIFTALIQDAENQMSEVFHYLDDQIGAIDLTIVGRGNFNCREGRIVDVKLTPSEKPKDAIAA
ncbi:MAG: hypothetical protein R6X10_09205 [Desulfobacterales bacterium]